MYCSSCGSAVAQGRSYCNYCGAKLNREDSSSKPAEASAESLIATIAAVFIFGLGIITAMMGVMKVILKLPVEQVLAFSLLPFLLLLVLEGIFIRLLMRRTKGTAEPSSRASASPREGQATNELDAAKTLTLPEPVPSVTEHTTRAFDPIYTERNSK